MQATRAGCAALHAGEYCNAGKIDPEQIIRGFDLALHDDSGRKATANSLSRRRSATATAANYVTRLNGQSSSSEAEGTDEAAEITTDSDVRVEEDLCSRYERKKRKGTAWTRKKDDSKGKSKKFDAEVTAEPHITPKTEKVEKRY